MIVDRNGTAPIVEVEREIERRTESAILDVRLGRYREGLEELERIFRASSGLRELPVRLFPDYAVALAGAEKRIEEARQLCAIAIAREPDDAEHLANLARVEVLAGDRGAAVRALRRSEELEPANLLAERLWAEIGRRGAAPIPFLPRESGVNRAVGKLMRRAA